jgi:carbazole 1,9a-dioxygenase terminal dioxygenase component
MRGLQNSPMVRYPDSNTLRFEEAPGVAKSMFTNSSQWRSVWSAELDGVIVSAGGDPDRPQLRDRVQAPDVVEQGGGAAHLPCMYEANGFPDGKQTHFEWFVPIDEGHHMYTILQSVIVHSDEEEAEFHREADEKWGPLVWSMDPDIEGFNNFDAFGRAEVMHGYNVEDFWHKEYFYKPDFVLTQWRMFVAKHAREVQKRTDMRHRPPLEESTVVYYNEPGTIQGGQL